MIETTFNPKEVEPRWSKAWEESGAFKPKNDPDAESFCIVIPPPNVTGSLHIGHALNNTLQDILVRFERLRGKSVLWQPGTDHAGIATQMVVERQLAETGNMDRRALGREEFLKRVWAWKETSGGMILNQLRRLGASCDWSRERFTMDEGLSAAVRKVFVQLHKEGLIYKDKRLVNWDPHFETAISDLEVENREVNGHFWHFKYPLENGETYQFPIAHDADGNPTEWETRNYIAIATTRPETMLGDGAVAVHPSDARYAGIVGKRVLLPLADRYIPIIADDYPDPAFGSGAVKITGAHDFNDYKVARAHDLPLYVLMDTKGRMADADYVPKKYRGMDRFDARSAVVEDIEKLGLLDRIEDKKIMQPFGDRSNVVIEPMLTEQWYVNAGELAKPAIAAVESSKTKIIPEAWTKTYFHWMRNIEPWCVSRQLWWGHRIPAWYVPHPDDLALLQKMDGSRVRVLTVVAESEEDAAREIRALYGDNNLSVRFTLEAGQKSGEITPRGSYVASFSDGKLTHLDPQRDPDVLDTWFSSALWPFSTLGWPEKTPELKRFYPTSTLVTAHDILFFWVARMMMMGLHFMKEVPFDEVYIHALVRDAKGAKMSKSKGNTMDPLELIDKFGADALRFTLAAMAAQGRDIKLSEQRIEGYRNFGTKLWNASRFAQMNECAVWDQFDPKSPQQLVNKWIVGETAKAASEVTRELEARRFNEAAGALYKFVWNVYCDWYLEFIKPLLNGEDEAAKLETRRTAAWALDQILTMLHPFMPFITEELWERLGEYGSKRDGMLITGQWPQLSLDLVDAKAEAEINWMLELISETRSTRSQLNVPAGAKIPLLLIGADNATQARLERYQDLIDRMARLEYSTSADAAPKGSVTFVLQGATVALPLEGVVDLPAESARLAKEIAKLQSELGKMDQKLGNADFISRAPEEVVDEMRERREDAGATLEKLSGALAQIKGGA